MFSSFIPYLLFVCSPSVFALRIARVSITPRKSQIHTVPLIGSTFIDRSTPFRIKFDDCCPLLEFFRSKEYNTLMSSEKSITSTEKFDTTVLWQQSDHTCMLWVKDAMIHQSLQTFTKDPLLWLICHAPLLMVDSFANPFLLIILLIHCSCFQNKMKNYAY